MKLAIIGGGGVRAPLFVQSALKRAGRLGLTEICLMDTDAEQLQLIGVLCAELARRAGTGVAITTTTSADEAFTGVDHVVTTVRPGGAEGRITDERIAHRHGVLGQETTGACGFAMAFRSIPTILSYARRLREVAPDAWLYNFTNPAGLVSQALSDAGISRCVGICDSANGAQNAIAHRLGIDPQAVEADLFGLNHLSFTRQAKVDGVDRLPEALADDAFLAGTNLRVFEPRVVRRQGMWINEYLYYYHYVDQAMAAHGNGPTRGEEVLELNRQLIADLRRIDAARHPDAALAAYFDYEHRRSGSYMAHATQIEADTDEEAAPADDGEGYAGVALSLMEALEGRGRIRTGLNVVNHGAIADLHDDDVVEVSCIVDQNGIQPVPVGRMPEDQGSLVHSVKHYERLAAKAILTRDRALAIDALVAHPLVLSYSRAEPLVDDFLAAYPAYAEGWA
ncbi:MAG TPA: 6-phospho-beta-glucosidase [Devosia sp.]|nr:6-phospho-beta-glucosidase [Devosia sp.]